MVSTSGKQNEKVNRRGGRGLIPQKRRRSRETALQILYSMEIRKTDDPEEALLLFPFEQEDVEVVRYAGALVRGIHEKRYELDRIILDHIVGWRPERMVVVDRIVIRLALYEGLLTQLTPVAVAISEAVELAKRFGTDDSGRFVNGVLGRIVRASEGKNAQAPDTGKENTDS